MAKLKFDSKFIPKDCPKEVGVEGRWYKQNLCKSMNYKRGDLSCLLLASCVLWGRFYGIRRHQSSHQWNEEIWTNDFKNSIWLLHSTILWYDWNQGGMNVYPKFPGWARLYDIGSIYLFIPIPCRKALGIYFPLPSFMVPVIVASVQKLRKKPEAWVMQSLH